MSVQPALSEAIETWVDLVYRGIRCTDDKCTVDPAKCPKGRDKFCLVSDAIAGWCDSHHHTTLADAIATYKEMVLKRIRGEFVADDELAKAGNAAVSAINRVKMLLAEAKDGQGQPGKEATRTVPSIDHEDEMILRALDKWPHQLRKQDDIAEDSWVSRKTVSNRLRAMLSAGLVERPKGPKSGTTITEKGSKLLKQIDGQKVPR